MEKSPYFSKIIYVGQEPYKVIFYHNIFDRSWEVKEVRPCDKV
jgi:hypothetical protein